MVTSFEVDADIVDDGRNRAIGSSDHRVIGRSDHLGIWPLEHVAKFVRLALEGSPGSREKSQQLIRFVQKIL
jgi:hypothetical protein